MMNTKTRLILIVALLGISAVVLVVALVQCGGPPDSTTVDPSIPTATPEPVPALTAGESLARELIQLRGQVTYSTDGCSRILETEPWCTVIESAAPITRSEWEELLPQTEFFLVKTYLMSGGEPGDGGGPRNWLIVEQDGQRYTAEAFDRLLKANDVITITDENRELVAKAFALMTIPDYLEEEVVFTEWRDATSQSTRPAYNHCLLAWTKLGGLEVGWCFVFQNERLKIASGPGLQQSRVGDYIPADPLYTVGLSFKDYRFRGE